MASYIDDRPKLSPAPECSGLPEPMYVLLADYEFTVRQSNGRPRTFTVHRGYTYDGASIWSKLGLTWVLSVSPFHPYVMRAALQHDVLCDIQPPFFGSGMAAVKFGNDCLADGIAPRKVRRMVRAVKWFGPRWGMTDA